jgi:hypothetical protein
MAARLCNSGMIKANGPTGRGLEVHTTARVRSWRHNHKRPQEEAYDYILRERGMCPGPYRIWLQNPELLKAMTPIGVYYQKNLQISRQEHEIVTNCINGKWPTARRYPWIE